VRGQTRQGDVGRALLAALGILAVPAALAAQKPAAAAPADRYAAVDALADSAPASVARSVPALAAYLSLAGPDELLRTRALFRWVAGHIAYDVAGFVAGSYGDLSPDGVLRRGSSVCEGYARLSEALGTAMGLQIQVVSGWSKGYGYTSGQRVGNGPTNHAWNVVRIGGRWRLMDATWGAGYLDQRSQFVRRFQDHYFLTAPEAFVFDHLPEDPRWQLLERPISAADYENLVYLRPMFFVAGLRVGDQPHARLTAAGRISVTLGVTRPVELMARVVDAGSDRNVDGDWSFVQVGSTEARIDAVFPRAGDYILRVFAKPRGTEGSFAWALDYRVQATAGAPNAAFPMTFGSFGSNGEALLEPLTGVLQAGRTYHFRIRAPNAQEVAVVVGREFTHLTRNGDEFAGDVLAVAGDMMVVARSGASGSYSGLLKYTGR
jgi:hypothetical protein